MSPNLTFGYVGWESGNFKERGITFTSKNVEEPVKTIDKIVKYFKLDGEKANIKVDMNIVWQGKNKDKKKIKNIWKEISSNDYKWNELREKFLELLRLGEGLLPVIFDIKFKEILLEIVDGENTMSITHKNLKKLKEFEKIIKKDKRTTPYGMRGSKKILLEK